MILHGRRSGIAWLIVLALAAAVGCNANSPTGPNPTPVDVFTGSLTGNAVVSGELVSGGGGALGSESFSSTASGVANVRVSVAGTAITDTTDGAGRFRLPNAPDGTLELQFVGAGLNAQLALDGVTEALAITVQAQGSSVQLVAATPSALERFNELAVSVMITDPIIGAGTIELERGGTAEVDATTMWDPNGDLFDLAAVAAAVAGDLRVKIKGQGTRDPVTGVILLSQIRAKIIAGGELAEIGFDGPVASASGADPDGTILLADNSKGPLLQVDVDGETEWDADGDYVSLTELLDAVDAGLLVNVEGEGTLDPSGTFILAGTIKAETVVADFEGPVASAGGADPDGSILLVSNSKDPALQVDVDAATEWDPSGDYTSLAELIAALGGGTPVSVEGEGAASISGVFILAATIKAETIAEGGDFAEQIEAIESLIDEVLLVAAANGLNNGQTNALVSKLENAIKSLEKGNANPARGQLGAFINQVEAFGNNGKIAAADATALVEAAQEIIDSLS